MSKRARERRRASKLSEWVFGRASERASATDREWESQESECCMYACITGVMCRCRWFLAFEPEVACDKALRCRNGLLPIYLGRKLICAGRYNIILIQSRIVLWQYIRTGVGNVPLKCESNIFTTPRKSLLATHGSKFSSGSVPRRFEDKASVLSHGRARPPRSVGRSYAAAPAARMDLPKRVFGTCLCN